MMFCCGPYGGGLGFRQSCVCEAASPHEHIRSGDTIDYQSRSYGRKFFEKQQPVAATDSCDISNAPMAGFSS
eukprot:2195339-Amphidinium_carterae.1